MALFIVRSAIIERLVRGIISPYCLKWVCAWMDTDSSTSFHNSFRATKSVLIIYRRYIELIYDFLSSRKNK